MCKYTFKWCFPCFGISRYLFSPLRDGYLFGYLNGDPLDSDTGINSKVWTRAGGEKKVVHPSEKNYRASCLRSFKRSAFTQGVISALSTQEAASPSSWLTAVVLQSLSHVQFFWNPMTAAHQAPLSMGFPRQEYWSGLPFPAPGDLPDPEMGPTSLASLLYCKQIFYRWATGDALIMPYKYTECLFGKAGVWGEG